MKLGLAVRREKVCLNMMDGGGSLVLKRSKDSTDGVEKRQRFVGSLTGGDLGEKFRDECGQDHSGTLLLLWLLSIWL